MAILFLMASGVRGSKVRRSSPVAGLMDWMGMALGSSSPGGLHG